MTEARTGVHARHRLLLVPVCLTLLAVCTGCPPLDPTISPTAPRTAKQALSRINTNFEKLAGTLYCQPATVSFKIEDANGKTRNFIGHPATIIFDGERCLYFDIKSPLAGSVARIGANDERYWLWLDVPDTRKLWWGTWDALESGAAREMALRPDLLLDALMMRALPNRLRGGWHPLLRVNGNDHRLLFQALDTYAWPYVRRELVLDPRPPYLPIEIIDRDGQGQIVMRARLRDFRPVEGTGPNGPRTARKFEVRWPQQKSEMRLDLGRVRYRTKDLPFCDFPDGWNGEVELLDSQYPITLDE